MTIIIQRRCNTRVQENRNVREGATTTRASIRTCLPQERAFGKVDDQIEAKKFLVVDGVSHDVNTELAYVAMSQGRVSGDSMDEPGGISLGRSAVCTIVYSPSLTGHWIVAFAFLLISDPSHD